MSKFEHLGSSAEATETELKKVRVINFKTSEGRPGTVTGILVDAVTVQMYSVGRLWSDLYYLPEGSMITSMESV